MAAMAELSLTLDLMGKHFFTETTWTIETNFFRNVHLMGLYKFSFFYGLPMIISGQFGFNCPSGFREEAF
jgi:hypothetical protein